MQTKCIQCGSSFEAARATRKFCSGACQKKNERGIKPEMKSQAVAKVAVEKVAEFATDKFWLKSEYLKHQPRVFPDKMTASEVHKRLWGGLEYAGVVSGGIDGYNRSQLEAGQPWHCSTQREVETWLAKSGYDPKLAKGLTYAPVVESPILAEIARRENAGPLAMAD